MCPAAIAAARATTPPRFWQLNVDGSVALLTAARKAGVATRVVFSSRAVFGATREGPLGDDAKPSPDTHYGAAKAELETFVRKFARGLADRRAPADRRLRNRRAGGAEQMVLPRQRRA